MRQFQSQPESHSQTPEWAKRRRKKEKREDRNKTAKTHIQYRGLEAVYAFLNWEFKLLIGKA